MRILGLMLAIVALFAIPFLIFGERIEEYLVPARIIDILRAHGVLAAIAGIAAISADLVIPTPAQAIMTAFGLVHGWLIGGLLATTGTFLAGTIAYWLSRLFGRRAAAYIAGERDMARLHRFFERFGFLAIICSRWIPIVPEVVSCLAGITGMPHARFILGNLIGSTTVGFFYAAFGHYYGDTPEFALTVALVVPVLLLPIFFFVVARSERSATPDMG